MPKGKRRKRTEEEYDKELVDAVKRIGKQKEARQAASNSSTWMDYLINTLNFNESSFESDRGDMFWNDVRLALKKPDKVTIPRPTQQQLAEANATIYENISTKQVSYRGVGGRFVKASAIVKGEIIGF